MQLIDWNVAAATAKRFVPPGPRLPLTEAVAIVDDLRALAEKAEAHVRDYTGLTSTGNLSPVVVVDRPGWIDSNVEGFSELVDPIIGDVLGRRARTLGPVMSAVGARATGAETGLLLGYLATRVLGQFELVGSGRLTLVAPNIVSAERSLAVDPHDFRLWVCLHEVTHRAQFDAAPWLRDHVRTLLHEYLAATDLDPAALARRLRGSVGAILDTIRGGSQASLLEIVQTPEQRAVLDRITGLMSLLEGHADVVMDGVGPAVVPSVATIRTRFEIRRKRGGPVEQAIRRLLGIDLKMRQYAEGAVFVRAVLDAVGMSGLNRVWAAADALPTAVEIRDPQRWLGRVTTAA